VLLQVSAARRFVSCALNVARYINGDNGRGARGMPRRAGAKGAS